MASWNAPYYPWASSDGIINTDLTRIEENTDYLKDEQDDIKVDVTDVISNFDDLFDSYDVAVTPDITSSDSLVDTVDNLNKLPSNNLISGLHIGIRKNAGVYDRSHVSISPGFCNTSASLPSFSLIFTSIVNKDISNNWAAGNNNGGFPSGLTAALDTTYRVFIIGNKDTSVIDAGFDTDANASNLLTDATGYTHYRQIGTVRTSASSASEIRFSEDYALNFNVRRTVKSIFPMTTVGYVSNYEITCESVKDNLNNTLHFNLDQHVTGTPTGNQLEYAFITNNTPAWASAVSLVDDVCSGSFQNGNSVEFPGMLQLDASTPKLIAWVFNTVSGSTSTGFTTGGVKGSTHKQTFNFTTWIDN